LLFQVLFVFRLHVVLWVVVIVLGIVIYVERFRNVIVVLVLGIVIVVLVLGIVIVVLVLGNAAVDVLSAIKRLGI